MGRPMCGDGFDGTPRAENHDCPNVAIRKTYCYEFAYWYVCDIDHEGFEPWTDGDIMPIPEDELNGDGT